MSSPKNFSFVDEIIAGSAIPFSEDNIEFLINSGIKYIISLTEEGLETYFPHASAQLTLVHIPIFGPPTDSEVIQFLNIISKAERANEKVMIHCQYGQERTGCFLAIYLIEKKGYSFEEAISLVKKTRPNSLQSSSMIRFLHNRYSKKN